MTVLDDLCLVSNVLDLDLNLDLDLKLHLDLDLDLKLELELHLVKCSRAGSLLNPGPQPSPARPARSLVTTTDSQQDCGDWGVLVYKAAKHQVIKSFLRELN